VNVSLLVTASKFQLVFRVFCEAALIESVAVITELDPHDKVMVLALASPVTNNPLNKLKAARKRITITPAEKIKRLRHHSAIKRNPTKA
jgi:hypothetical protein